MDSLTLSPRIPSLSFISTNLRAKHLSRNTFSFFRPGNIDKLKPSTASFCHQSPSNQWNPRPWIARNGGSLLKPFWVLIPLVHSIRGLACSRLRTYSADTEEFFQQHDGKWLQSGGIGVALLSVTASAKVKISPFVATLAANPTFVSGLFAWATAQSLKMFLNFFLERKWDFRLLFASGGMPSSHSALCMALTTSVAFCHGLADSLFPVCLGFSLIVMYDAIGVRRHAGMQAEVLNLIVRDLFQGHPISQRKLKELLGHTPSQVLAGAVLGIVVACICCQSCLIAS